MDEDLLFKTHNESKIPEINLNRKKTQKQTTFSQKFENGFLKEESCSFRKTLKNRQEKSIAKVLQNYDYKTNILSNITVDKDTASPFLSNIIYYSFSSDCLFKIRRSNRCAIRNHKNENILPINKKMLLLNDKYYSGFNSIMKNNSPEKIINRTLCDFKESCLTNRQSNLKRKLESDVISELNLRRDYRNRNSSKLITYTERLDRTLSYSKHFKSDDSSQISENGSESFFLQPQFMNRIDTIENYNFKRMKNIEIQSSPVKIRVAANFGEDSVEYIDPTMEVELDSDDSDPDEPGEQNVGAAEDPHELNQTADTNNGENSEDDGNTSEVHVTNIVEEDNSNISQSEHPDTSNEDADKNNSILNEQCLDKDTHNNIEAEQNESDKDVVEADYKERALEKREEIDSENIKDSIEAKGNSPCLNSLLKDMLTPDKEGTTDTFDLKRTENDPITLDKISDEVNNGKLTSETGKHAMSILGANQTEFFMKECNAQQHEELEIDSRKDKTVEVDEVKKQTEISANIEDTKLSEDENFEEEAEKSESDKEKDDEEKAENYANEGQENVSKVVDCMEVNGDDGVTEESNERENHTCIDQSENISEKEEDILEEVVGEKISELVDEQENELQKDCNNKEAEENIIEDKIKDDAGGEKSNVHTESLENLEDILKNNHNINFRGNEKEEIECTKKINEKTDGYENESTANNVICKIEEDEKETAVDSDKSESNTDEISENKDVEMNEIKPDTANGGVPLKEVESCNKEKELEHEKEELNKIVKEKIEENLQSHSETVDEQTDNLKTNFLEEQQSLENLSHPIVENEEDSIEKDSIEDGDNCLSARKQETESQDLYPNLEKYEFEGEISEVSANELKCIKDESVSATENKSTEELVKLENNGVQQPILAENTTKSGDVSEKSEENNIEKEELSPEDNEFPNTILETVNIVDYITEKSKKSSVNDSKRGDEIDLASEKVDDTAIHEASENEIFDSESADENISDNKKHAKVKEERADHMTENLSDEERNKSTFSNIEKVDGKKEEEIIQKSKERENDNVTKSLLAGIVEATTGQVIVNDNGKKTCEEETFISCKSTTQESTPKEGRETVYETITDQPMVRSSEKQKTEKPEQSSSDSAKVISPRKGIKVEEDEIETAISSIVFYDEMSDGSEQIAQTVPSAAVFSKLSAENENISCESVLTIEDAQKTIEEEAGELPSSNVNENEPPLQATTDDGDLAYAETKAQPSTSPKKRKKKRKISRSRSAQKDGTSSATKRSQDSKGSARTARSVSSTSARSPSAGEKKLPPIKAPVGTTPPPNIKQVRSKIGSLDNVTHKPKGGDKKVETVKLEWNAKSKVGSLDYANHKPGGGDKKILTQKLQFKNVQSKVGSKDNLKHKPAGGNVKISTEKLDFKAKAASKVGSLDNAKHKPGGGNVAIKTEKLHFKERATPKIQSRSGSERGSSHGGSETQSPIMPSSPAPPEELPPLNEDENPSSQEEVKPENPQEKAECNGAGESTQEPPSNDASQTKSEVANTANDANNDNNANDGEDAKEDQLIAF